MKKSATDALSIAANISHSSACEAGPTPILKGLWDIMLYMIVKDRKFSPPKMRGINKYRLTWKYFFFISLSRHLGQIPHGEEYGQGKKSDHRGQPDNKDGADEVG